MAEQKHNDKDPKGNEPSQKQGFVFLIKYLFCKIKLRHLVFLLVAVVGLSLTATVIVILWKITSSGYNISPNETFIGVIGVLVAFVAAFMGVIATIMFGNSVYTSFMAQKAIEKIERHDKTLPDLYVLTLRNEANECEEKGDILRAIECRIGVIHNVLKSRYCTSGNINFYMDALKKTVSNLNDDKFLKYYRESKKSSEEILQEIEIFHKEILWRIANIYKSENGLLVAAYMKDVKNEIDSRLSNIKSELMSQKSAT